MNTRTHLQKEIKEFLQAENEKIMLITGTYQREKHWEVLKTLNNSVQDSVKVLFRINAQNNIDSIFDRKLKKPKLNTKIKLGNLRLYLDTINSRTWKYEDYNVSVLYPVDSVCRMKDEQRKKVISDLIRHTVNKVFIVSWTDNIDFSWLDEFGIDRKAIFDAEEEHPEWHNNVLDLINGHR